MHWLEVSQLYFSFGASPRCLIIDGVDMLGQRVNFARLPLTKVVMTAEAPQRIDAGLRHVSS